MRINFITHNNNIVFQKIQLENEENRTATELLNTLYNDEAKAETAKTAEITNASESTARKIRVTVVFFIVLSFRFLF